MRHTGRGKEINYIYVYRYVILQLLIKILLQADVNESQMLNLRKRRGFVTPSQSQRLRNYKAVCEVLVKRTE
ncbi:hypothetical protein SDC9_98612 [bioreactor metagenome]|uniref:Uncharacterized protein n=1 Tax=bioreactor metagenome TaxID=1076179 RepID=A0A645AHU7_9ZZZZ